MHPICHQNSGSLSGKDVALEAAVISNCRRRRLLAFFVMIEIIGKSLCRFSHRINIHAVRSGTKDSAQTGCSKGQIPVKPVVDLFRFSGNSVQIRFEIRVIQFFAAPCLIFFRCV